MRRTHSARTALIAVWVLSILGPRVRAIPDAFKGRDEEVRKLKARIRELEIEASACKIKVGARCPQKAGACSTIAVAHARKWASRILYALTFPWTYATLLEVGLTARTWVHEGGIQRLRTQICDGTLWRRLVRRIRGGFQWALEFKRLSLQVIQVAPRRAAQLISHGLRSLLQFAEYLTRTIGRNNLRLAAEMSLAVALLMPIGMAMGWGLLAAENVGKLSIRSCLKTSVALQVGPLRPCTRTQTCSHS